MASVSIRWVMAAHSREQTSTQGGTGRMPTESSLRGVGVRGVEESFLARRESFSGPVMGIEGKLEVEEKVHIWDMGNDCGLA